MLKDVESIRFVSKSESSLFITDFTLTLHNSTHKQVGLPQFKQLNTSTGLFPTKTLFTCNQPLRSDLDWSASWPEKPQHWQFNGSFNTWVLSWLQHVELASQTKATACLTHQIVNKSHYCCETRHSLRFAKASGKQPCSALLLWDTPHIACVAHRFTWIREK